jgi:hypothetical protein
MKNAVLILAAAVAVVLCAGCKSYTNITEMPYHGPAVCQGEGGMLGNVNGMPIWTGGTPGRKYRVLCGIEFHWVEDGSKVATRQYQEAVDEITRIARSKGAHALIVIGIDTKTIGHRQTVPIRSHKQYFQVVQYLQ